MKLLLIIIFLSFFDVAFAQKQENYEKNAVNCDSLIKFFEDMELKGFIALIPPKPLKPYEKVKKEFQALADSNLFFRRIYVEALVDTNGNVLCTKVIRGTNNITDSLASNYCKELKFIPATTTDRKKKVRFLFKIPLSPKKEKSIGKIIKNK